VVGREQGAPLLELRLKLRVFYGSREKGGGGGAGSKGRRALSCASNSCERRGRERRGGMSANAIAVTVLPGTHARTHARTRTPHARTHARTRTPPPLPPMETTPQSNLRTRVFRQHVYSPHLVLHAGLGGGLLHHLDHLARPLVRPDADLKVLGWDGEPARMRACVHACARACVPSRCSYKVKDALHGRDQPAGGVANPHARMQGVRRSGACMRSATARHSGTTYPSCPCAPLGTLAPGSLPLPAPS
jgi:hypothetical protein